MPLLSGRGTLGSGHEGPRVRAPPDAIAPRTELPPDWVAARTANRGVRVRPPAQEEGTMPRMSVRVLVALAVAVPFAVTSFALAWLVSSSTRRIAEELAPAIVEGATARVVDQLRAYLDSAARLADAYDRRIQTGALPTTGLSAWERALAPDLVANPGVASICFGAVTGESCWLLRGRRGLELGIGAGPGHDETVEFPVDERGEIIGAPIRTYQYDPRHRPWYQAARGSAGPVWTPIYFWFGDAGAASETSTGYVRTIKNADGSVAGVLVIDVTLSALSRWLREAPFALRGSLFIVDSTDKLVAASHGAVNSDAGTRLSLRESESSAARAAAVELARSAHRDAGLFAAHIGLTSVTVDGAPARMTVTAATLGPGIDWRVIALLPEAAFLTESQRVRSRATWFALAASAASVLLGLRVASALARPVVTLTDHVRRVGAGDFESRVNLNAARELAVLSEELNRMSAGLKQRLELQQAIAVATEVQQSLLPLRDPTPERLEVVGRARYCDSTGGDYYDFIDVADTHGKHTLIAIGDVMGHGIAAALLMASARAALRAHATSAPDLAQLMNRVNRSLADDARHARFVTLSLLVIDPVAGTIRYASAGHEAPLLLHGDGQRFEELEGGSPPLGIEANVVYEEYRAKGIEPGTLVFVGTDGIWEARNEAGDFFGKDRLRSILRESRHRPVREIASALEARLEEFRNGSPALDDITFVIVKVLK